MPDIQEALANEQAQIRQGWSLVAALHCVLLPELVDKQTYKPPKIELLARRWQERCFEVSDIFSPQCEMLMVASSLK